MLTLPCKILVRLISISSSSTRIQVECLYFNDRSNIPDIMTNYKYGIQDRIWYHIPSMVPWYEISKRYEIPYLEIDQLSDVNLDNLRWLPFSELFCIIQDHPFIIRLLHHRCIYYQWRIWPMWYSNIEMSIIDPIQIFDLHSFDRCTNPNVKFQYILSRQDHSRFPIYASLTHMSSRKFRSGRL